MKSVVILEERCHPERSEGSPAGQRSFAALRMTDQMADAVAPFLAGARRVRLGNMKLDGLVGAQFIGAPPIMCFQKLKWIIEEALAAHRPIS